MYLPWVLFGLNLVLSGGGMLELVGILVGHLYFFLKFKYPQEFGGPDLLSTPKFLEDYFPPVRGGVHQFGGPAGTTQRVNEPRPQARGGVFSGGHNWGRGQTLGQ